MSDESYREEKAMRDRAQALLDECLPRFSYDEMCVLLHVVEGIESGRKVYGNLRVGTDRRDFIEEAGQELRDIMVYAGAQLQRLARLQAIKQEEMNHE